MCAAKLSRAFMANSTYFLLKRKFFKSTDVIKYEAK